MQNITLSIVDLETVAIECWDQGANCTIEQIALFMDRGCILTTQQTVCNEYQLYISLGLHSKVV